MDVLDRLHQRLVQVLRQGWGAADSLTVADVYQHLIPYRQVRGELGLSELKEYEHALLRLLAGERGLVRVDVPEIVEEFRRELSSTNPILGIYRDYAAAPLSVNQDLAAPAPGEGTAETMGAPAEEDAADEADEADEAIIEEDTEPLPTLEPPLSPAAAYGEPAQVTAAPTRAAGPTSCWECSEPLPAERDARFCPHCGACQVPVPCLECGTSLEPQWKFCIQCGARKPSLVTETGGA